jgi:HEAT repeat protein
MRQNKQSISLFCLRRFALSLAAVVSAFLCLAVVNSERTRAQQPNANSAAQKSRPKRLTALRTSETPDGSRATITSDGELNDYSAYRSGDRFIVVVPQAEGTGGGGARGRGFEGAQVERRGKDVVYTFKLQPGATARVNQKFNRLDVQFSAPKDGAGNTANVRPTPAPTPKPARSPLPEEAGITRPTTNANNAQPTPDARRTPDVNANNNIIAANAQPTPLVSASPNASPLSGVVPSPTLAPTVAPPGTDQIAQVQPTSAAPVSITTNTPANTSTSVGAVVLRNWPWLIAALLAVGIGLIFVSRLTGDRDQSKSLPPAAPSGTKPSTVKETKSAELKSTSSANVISTTTATKATGATPATSNATAATTAATSATTAAAANLATSGKQSKKKKKKSEKAKRLAANEPKSSSADAGTSAANADTITAETDTATNDALTGGALATGAILAGAAAVAASGASEVEESKAAETKAVETKSIEAVVTETKASEPPVAFDPERVEVEIKKLLAGESYDESLINTTDAGTRQLVSAELMQAIAGRHAERKAHARTAFLKHGYFEEATRALQSAEAPGERAAAARTLGLYGDRSATVHLTAALEDPAADVRRTTVEALAELADPAAIGALEALRWRETSRQVPRTLIQRAIEASKAAQEEETAAAAESEKSDDDTPTLVTGESAAAVALAATQAPQLDTNKSEAKESETKEIELSYAEVPVATATSFIAEESDTETQAAPVLAASVMETPEAPFTTDDAHLSTDDVRVSTDNAPVVEAKTAFDVTEVEEVETKALELAAPQVEPAPAEEVRAEVETPATPVEIDLAATLAAKEASLIKAREQQRETAESHTATEAAAFSADSFATPSADAPVTSSADASVTSSSDSSVASSNDSRVAEFRETSLDLFVPVDLVAASEETVTETTKADDSRPPVHQSDFAFGSGKQPDTVEDDWINLDADEHEITVQSIEPAAASSQPPTETSGQFYAEGAAGWASSNTTDAQASQASRKEPVSLFDSSKVESFESDTAVHAPVIATPVDFSPLGDATTQPLARENGASHVEEQSHSKGIVKADKGLGLVDGSDEENFSIIPKGIQVRLTSDDASERAASVLALSRLNTDEAFNEICLAFDDPSEEVRNAAARALYDLNEDRADSFTRALRESPVERRRQIGAALAGSGLADEAVSNLTGESRDKTYDAFSLLFLMAKAGEVSPLIRAIESHADNEVRLAVVKLLALSGQHDILPAFRRLAVRGSLPTEVRSAVMEAIYQISSQHQNATPAT